LKGQKTDYLIDKEPVPAFTNNNHRGDYYIPGKAKKVTIILHISVQPSYNKADEDLYNPI